MILVTGATGKVGEELVKKLREAKIPFRAGVRSPERVPGMDGVHAGKTYKLSGPESLSNAEMAEKLSSAIGKKVTYVDLPDVEFKKALLATGVPEPYADALIDLIHYYMTGAAQEITPDVERVAGKKPTTFGQFARDYAWVWR